MLFPHHDSFTVLKRQHVGTLFVLAVGVNIELIWFEGHMAWVTENEG